MALDIIVSYSNINLLARATELAEFLQIPIIATQPDKVRTFLHLSESGLSIISYPHNITGFNLDFVDLLKKFTYQNIKQHPLQKTISGIKKNALVYDTTAGFAKDSLIFAHRGHRVIALEKNPFIYVLVQDALWRADNYQQVRNIKLIWQDSNEYLLAASIDKPAVIFIDPMFPERTKSALVKQPMQVLQLLSGSVCIDHSDLFNQSLTIATNRVVVKRPNNGAYLTGLKPDFSISSNQSTRFDVYLSHNK